MAEHLDYTTSKRKKQVIEFTVDGVDFKFTPPKRARMIMPVMEQDDADAMGAMAMKAQMDWLGQGLSEEQSQILLDRLRDDDDDFDTPDMDNLLEWLMKQVNGRPTG